MKKSLNLLFGFILIFLSLSFINVNAESIDLTKNGSISTIYGFGDKKFSNSTIYIYKIADVDVNGNYTYLDEFKVNSDVNGMSALKLKEQAVILNEYIEKNKISYLSKKNTDSDGKVIFNNLSTGLYLIDADLVSISNYNYVSSPILISLPSYNEIDNYYMYDITTILKTESSLVENNNTSGSTINSPNTIDNILVYFIMFFGSLFVVIGLIIYIKQSNKSTKKDKK